MPRVRSLCIRFITGAAPVRLAVGLGMRDRRLIVGVGVFFLAIGIGCVLTVLPRSEGPFDLKLVGYQTDGAGRRVGTFVLTNRSTRLIPTFAVSPPPLRPKPDEGEPMYWIETATGTGWRAKPGSAGLSYSRVLFPESAWRFQIALEPKDQPQCLRLTYILGKVKVPSALERLYLKLRGGSGPRPLSTSPRYVACDLTVPNKGVSGDAGPPHP